MFRRLLLRTAQRSAAAAAVGAAFAVPALCDAAPAATTPPTGLGSKFPSSVLTLGDDPTVTLEYFCLRGLGELPRLVLECTGTSYTSVFHFANAQYKSYATFGQLPVLRDGNLIVVESGTIVRHLARKLCIDGSTPEEKTLVDMYYELSKDILAQKAGVYDEAKDSPDAKKLHQFLQAAERQCSGSHFVGESLTLADIAMFNTLDTLVALRTGVLTEYKQLTAFLASFRELPNVAAYLDSPRRVPLTHNELGKGRKPGLEGYNFIAPLRVATYATAWKGP